MYKEQNLNKICTGELSLDGLDSTGEIFNKLINKESGLKTLRIGSLDNHDVISGNINENPMELPSTVNKLRICNNVFDYLPTIKSKGALEALFLLDWNDRVTEYMTKYKAEELKIPTPKNWNRDNLL
eukprot:GHVP01052835.1.p1 GENE.GHVP01052835.1~~GHVP01052835.1.p1  ORF type:complete len:127 (-),score=18.12 GHVP01052835.1:649-1029(-)